MSKCVTFFDYHWAVPPELQFWLYDTGSLTRHLTTLSKGQFYVEVVAQCYQPLSKPHQQFLQLSRSQLAWTRHSILYGCGEAWVSASSFFPIQTIDGRGRIFKHIGNRAIGHILFDRTMPRCQRRVVRLADGWSRQSYYLWHGCPILVQETFLPAFIAHLRQSTGAV